MSTQQNAWAKDVPQARRPQDITGPQYPPQQQQQQQYQQFPPQQYLSQQQHPHQQPLQQQQQENSLCSHISRTGLPISWDMMEDPQTGKTFYVNKSQKKTYWTLPQDALALIILPPNWEVSIDQGTNKLYYIDHNTKTTHWEYPYDKVISMYTNGNSSAMANAGKPEFSCDDDEASYSDPRVEELVAIGISRGAAVAAAKTNTIGDINDLIELILIKAKQNGHDIKLLSSKGNGQNSDDGNTCVICMTDPADCVVLDCKHMCTCSECSKRLAECPICRSPVKGIMKVFLK